jgi:AMMECR1 domain-containing protein
MESLSELCRQYLKSYLLGENFEHPNGFSAAYSPPNYGLYVSLYNGGRQRGCLGLTEPVLDVQGTALKLCVLSATQDDRFSPVTQSEVDQLQINIWLISEQAEVTSLQSIDFNEYGVVIKHQKGQATLLPYFTKTASAREILNELAKKSKRRPDELIEARAFKIRTDLINQGTFDFKRPKVLRGAAKEWSALSKWTPQFFAEKFGDLIVPIRKFDKPGVGYQPSNVSMSIREYLKYWCSLGNTEPKEILYFANWLYEKEGSFLNNDFNLPICFTNDLIDLLPKSLQYPRRWLFWGHQYCSTPGHVDTLYTSAWLAMIIGRKRVRMVSPEYSQCYPILQDLDSPQSIEFCEFHKIPIVEEVIEPGDILFIPGGWLHHVTSLEPNLLLTGNFLDPICKDMFFTEILRKTDQAQGVLKIKRDLEIQMGAPLEP